MKTFELDGSSIQALRQDSSAEACVEHAFKALVEMANAIGVEVTYSIDHIDDEKVVNQAQLIGALNKLTPATGAMLTGGRANLLKGLAK